MSPRPAALLLAPLLFAGCQSGLSGASKRKMNTLIAEEKYGEAEAFLDRAKDIDYGRKNMVLFYLDKAAVQHHEGKYKESDRSFDIAERRMDELYTKSITKAGGMLLLNDTTVDYAGEPFERALLNVFRALNYVMLGEPEAPRASYVSFRELGSKRLTNSASSESCPGPMMSSMTSTHRYVNSSAPTRSNSP